MWPSSKTTLSQCICKASNHKTWQWYGKPAVSTLKCCINHHYRDQCLGELCELAELCEQRPGHAKKSGHSCLSHVGHDGDVCKMQGRT